MNTTGVIFTQQMSANPWHQCPTAQFVLTMAGSWYVNATDGSSIVMTAGDVLYQDDMRGLRINGREPSHYSGSAGDAPCNQLVISTSMPARLGPSGACDWVDSLPFR